jgi:hypothetical protein
MIVESRLEGVESHHVGGVVRADIGGMLRDRTDTHDVGASLCDFVVTLTWTKVAGLGLDGDHEDGVDDVDGGAALRREVLNGSRHD